MGKPRTIGTRAETAVVRYLFADGWLGADRQPLRGARDQGDLIVNYAPRIIAQVKAGDYADKASDAKVAGWWVETENQAVAAGADFGVLIVRRKGRKVAHWDAFMSAADWVGMITRHVVMPTGAPWIMRTTLADWSRIAGQWVDTR